MIASKNGPYRQHSQDITNLLETSMDSPMPSPIEQGGVARSGEKLIESQSSGRKDYRITQLPEIADWNPLSGWQGGPVPKSSLVNKVITPGSSSAVKSKPRLTIDRPDRTIEVCSPPAPDAEHYIKHVPQVKKKLQDDRKHTVTIGHKVSRERRVQVSEPYTTEKRNIQIIPDPNLMNLADFVRTSLGFQPIEVTRFQKRAKANLIRSHRKSIVSDYPIKLESPRLDKSVLMMEGTNLEIPFANRATKFEIPNGYANLDSELSLRHKYRPLLNFSAENKNGPSYLDQKKFLNDTKKLLSNLSRIRVMKILNNTTMAEVGQTPSNIEQQKPEKNLFSLHVRQASASEGCNAPPHSQQDIGAVSQRQLGLSSSLQCESRQLREAPDRSSLQMNQTHTSVQRPQSQVVLSPYLNGAIKASAATSGGPNRTYRSGRGYPKISPRKDHSREEQRPQGLSSFGHSPEHAQLTLVHRLAALQAQRMAEGTAVRHTFFKSQSPKISADRNVHRELSTQRRQKLGEWKQNFERSKEGLYPTNSGSEAEASETQKLHGRAECNNYRSDIEGLMWQVDSLGKKTINRFSKEQKQYDPSRTANSARVPGSRAKAPLADCTVERKPPARYEQVDLVDMGKRHVRSMSMGLMSSGRCEPVVSITSSSGRLLGRYQLKKRHN